MMDDAVRRAEALVLEAATDPAAWSLALGEICRSAGAYGATMLPLEGRVPGTPHSDSLSELADSYFRGGWAERDFRIRGIPKLSRTGVVVEQDFTTEAQMRKEPYYQELLAPFGLRWFSGVAVRADEDVWCLAFQRTEEQGFFTRDEQLGLRRLAAPLSRAATLGRRISAARLAGLTDVLEAVGCASLLLDRAGHVTRANRRAELILGKDLAIARGELLVPRDAGVSAAIRRHVAAVLWSAIYPDAPSLSPVAVPRPGRRPLILQAQSLSGAGSDFFAPGRAIVFVTDPDERCAPARETLRLLFDLTEAEARLAVSLAGAFQLPLAAKKMGVSYETARTYLKSVFAKTGTRNQAELLSLLARIARQRPQAVLG